MIGGLVLAAGAGRRFGGLKQLADLHGRPLLEHAVTALVSVPALDEVVVVLGAGAEEVRAGVALGRARSVAAPGWEEGQAASLRAGLAALPGADAVLVALGDQPGLTAAAVEAVLEARGGGAQAVRATYGGAPGHPVLLERALLARASELRGDAGFRALLAGAPVRDAPCDGLADPRDVDTPEGLAALVRASAAQAAAPDLRGRACGPEEAAAHAGVAQPPEG